jgi:hypothetical protein
VPPAGSAPARPSRVALRLHAALVRADRPLRARCLAYDLGLPAAEVTAELRRLQDLGVASSRDRRWTVVETESDTTGEPVPPRKTA